MFIKFQGMLGIILDHYLLYCFRLNKINGAKNPDPQIILLVWELCLEKGKYVKVNLLNKL